MGDHGRKKVKNDDLSHFDPKMSELHDTREMGDLRTAAGHQLLNTTVSVFSTVAGDQRPRAT